MRLAARGTSRPPTQDDRSVSPFFGQYNLPEYSQIPVPPVHAESSDGSNASSSKRTLPENEATPAPKPKRPKAKAKTTGSDTPSKSTARKCSRSLFVIPVSFSVPYFRHPHLKIAVLVSFAFLFLTSFPIADSCAPAASRRGYNAKKRSEAAFISAQNGTSLIQGIVDRGTVIFTSTLPSRG